MKQHLNAIFNGYSEIFFLKNYGIGLIVLAITLINPNVALAGVIAVVAAYLFARLINVDRDFLKLGFYTYNPLLVGLSIGYLFKLTPLTGLFLITGGIFTFAVTMVMYNLLATYLRLPVLSLPFVIVSTIAYLASAKYVNLPLNEMYSASTLLDLYLPLWLAGYCKALGAIFFMPYVLPGLIFALGILATSRILFLLSLVGYYTGTIFTTLMVGSSGQAFSDINHFNCILVAMAVGGIFLIPSIKSYLLAVIAVCVSTVLLDSVLIFWAYAGIPGFTLPFNVVLLTFIYVLGLVNYPHLARLVKNTPEETLDTYLSNQRRYRGSDKTLMLPFSGKWTVWQGFEGQWTHQGAWKYAYDFIITDEQGNSHRHGGHYLGDYYAYHKPVLSPVAGHVVKVINHLPDNPIGQVDRANNWGNLVIINDARGFFVEISHFAQGSIQVAEGAWVEPGTFLGLCGNSGYSPQPHIHLQVQLAETAGAYTVPFSFVSYANDNYFHANELPPEGTQVEPLYGDKTVTARTSFILDDVYQYEVFKSGKKVENLTLTVKMLADGTFYFDSGRGKLYFGQYDKTFYFYSVAGRDPYLQTMFLALPRLPLAYRENLTWSDQIPVGPALAGWRRAAVQFISSFYHNFAQIQTNLRWTHKNIVEGRVQSPTLRLDKKTLVEWDDQRGFKAIQVDDLELRRVKE